ncbi:MAG: CNNM domain-containing protein [Oligoflexia bacterium]|nr:CNNM domain-containing protein [Oligoflexia bacterium]
MISLLVVAVVFSLGSSFCCSLAEASLFTVPLAHAKAMADRGSRSGELLVALKEDIEKPITAVLILNTLANTVGASIAGALAGQLWGEVGLVAFSTAFALAVLYLAEVAPKFAGVVYAREVAPFVAYPLTFLVRLFHPLIWVSLIISSRIGKGEDSPKVSQEEVLSLAAMGAEEGALDRLEGSVINNVIGLDQILVRDILTPRVAVFRMPEQLRLGEVEQQMLGWEYTRVPLFNEDDPEQLTAYVRQRDIYRELVRGQRDRTLKEVSRPLTTVPELARVDKILVQMFERNEAICAVADEHGTLAGVITLEDILEEVVGHEIIDEYDLDATRRQAKGRRAIERKSKDN